MIKLLNAVLFNVGWWSAVLGAANGLYWLGPLVIALVIAAHLAVTRQWRRELLLVAACGAIGIVVDSALIAGGAFSAVGGIGPAWLLPPWLLAMWLQFGITLNYCLGFLKHRPAMAALFGAIGGPLAYYGGSGFGPIAFPHPPVLSILVLALVWGALLPALFKLADLARVRDLSSPPLDGANQAAQ